MKTSNKLLIALFTVGLLTLIGANLALKAEHDKIDFNDPFYGLSVRNIKPFRVLKLEGNNAGLLSVQTGPSSEIRLSDKEKDLFTFRSQGDTLLVSYKPKEVHWHPYANMYFDAQPAAIILTPTLTALYTDQVSCNLKRFQADNLTIWQQHGGVLISNSAIGNLTVTDSRGSELHTKPDNRIGRATITSRDSSLFIVERDVFGALSLQTDSLATVKMPGSLLGKIKP
ncbi:hypothetical protein ACO2Q8_07685 [Larkinella sp. VNQ87]|uniref:hypothetical protein n=1 Tax=Larkinella sp. VNQ87 TaxID=3400921 RepID=UPI003C0575E9